MGSSVSTDPSSYPLSGLLRAMSHFAKSKVPLTAQVRGRGDSLILNFISMETKLELEHEKYSTHYRIVYYTCYCQAKFNCSMTGVRNVGNIGIGNEDKIIHWNTS